MTDAEIDQLAGVQHGQFDDQPEMSPEQAEEFQQLAQDLEPQEAPEQQQAQPQLRPEQQALQQALENYQNLPPEQKEQVALAYMNDSHARALEACDPHMSNLFTRGFGQLFGVPNLDQQVDSRNFAAFMFSWGENLLHTLAARQQQQPARQSSGRQTRSAGRQAPSRGRSGSPFRSNSDLFDNATLDAWARDHGKI
jgi:hypothetical protein